jgi:hypothetical protein
MGVSCYRITINVLQRESIRLAPDDGTDFGLYRSPWGTIDRFGLIQIDR